MSILEFAHPYPSVLIAAFLVLFWLSKRSASAALPDTSKIACSRKKKISGTAVISGGSISGILTARVCADHFDEVLLVDPEFTQALTGSRKKRVVQFNSSHFFLYAGVKGLRSLWPQIDRLVLEAGGLIADADMHMHINDSQIVFPWRDHERPHRPEMFLIRRSVLELILEKLLVETCPNIRVIDGTVRQISLQPGDQNSVQSVIVRGPEGHTFALNDPALLVDCTGVSHAGTKWLKAAGIGFPDSLVSKYDPNMHYATAVFSPSPEVWAKLPIPGGFDNARWIHSRVPIVLQGENKVLFFNRYENNLVGLCLGGWGNATLPRQPEEIPSCLDMGGLPGWVMQTAKILVETSSPTIEFVTLPPCTWTHYETIQNVPSNFVVVGDAMSKVNPAKGQGMSKALISLKVLSDLLSTCSTTRDIQQGLSKEYFKAMAPINKGIWESNKFGDYTYATTRPGPGESRSEGRFAVWFFQKILETATKDEETAKGFAYVQHLVKPVSSLFTFKVMFAVFKHIIVGD